MARFDATHLFSFFFSNFFLRDKTGTADCRHVSGKKKRKLLHESLLSGRSQEEKKDIFWRYRQQEWDVSKRKGPDNGAFAADMNVLTITL